MFEHVRVDKGLTLRRRRDPRSREVPFVSGGAALLMPDPGYTLAGLNNAPQYMQSQVIPLENTMWKSLLIADDELWLSGEKQASFDSFSQARHKTGMMKTTTAFALFGISQVSFSEADKTTKSVGINEKERPTKCLWILRARRQLVRSFSWAATRAGKKRAARTTAQALAMAGLVYRYRHCRHNLPRHARRH